LEAMGKCIGDRQYIGVENGKKATQREYGKVKFGMARE